MKTHWSLAILFITVSLRQIPSPALDELTSGPSCSQTLTLGQDVATIPEGRLPFSVLGFMIVLPICQENPALPRGIPVHQQ